MEHRELTEKKFGCAYTVSKRQGKKCFLHPVYPVDPVQGIN
jgi:hypothetical protein